MEMAISFFHHLGDIAQSYGVIICLEPNPVQYGSNFMTTSEETTNVVEQIGHHAIRMQFDTGAIAVNEENIDVVLARSHHLIAHMHASEPGLLPLGQGEVEHEKVYSALLKYKSIPQLICIEMAATKSQPHHISVERALSYAIRKYRKTSGQLG